MHNMGPFYGSVHRECFIVEDLFIIKKMGALFLFCFLHHMMCESANDEKQ